MKLCDLKTVQSNGLPLVGKGKHALNSNRHLLFKGIVKGEEKYWAKTDQYLLVLAG